MDERLLNGTLTVSSINVGVVSFERANETGRISFSIIRFIPKTSLLSSTRQSRRTIGN